MHRATITLTAAFLLVGGCNSNPYNWKAVTYPSQPAPSTERFIPPPEKVAAVAQLQVIATGLDEPLAVVDAPGDTPGRLYVVQRGGLIRIIEAGTIAPTPFADLSDWITTKDREQGLLGLAFHPKFAANRKLYVNFTNPHGATRVVELTANADGTAVDKASARTLLRIDQPYVNHNGGHLAFGPDGLLYVGTGDGGDAGDPRNYGQSYWVLLAKLLTLDVNATSPKPQVVQLGLRNPWRYAFDRDTGDLYIADVGQDMWEAVYVIPAGTIKGRNLGWRRTEGSHCFEPSQCEPAKYTMPVVEYDHSTGCSVTGGYVYRGEALPELRGHYFFADFCTAVIRSFRYEQGDAVQRWEWRPQLDPGNKLAQLASFGEDEQGELYLVSLDGVIHKLVRAQ